MLGALEVKIVRHVAAQRPGWKPLHTAVLSCLLAHRNRQGQAWPMQELIAGFCRVSERTARRALTQLLDWGVIKPGQLRAVSSQKFGPVQYLFLFTLPQVVEENAGPSANLDRAVGQNHPEPSAKIECAIRKKPKDLKPERAEGDPSPKFERSTNRSRPSQQDFDERDWRRLNREIDTMREAGVGSADESDPVALFRQACARAGISTQRAADLQRKMA